MKQHSQHQLKNYFSIAAYFNFTTLILAYFLVCFSFFLLLKFVLHAFALALFSTRWLFNISPQETCLQDDAHKEKRDLSPIRINVINVRIPLCVCMCVQKCVTTLILHEMKLLRATEPVKKSYKVFWDCWQHSPSCFSIASAFLLPRLHRLIPAAVSCELKICGSDVWPPTCSGWWFTPFTGTHCLSKMFPQEAHQS